MNRKIFRAVDKKYIYSLFSKEKKIYFPAAKGDISEIKIECISPDWAKNNCLSRYEVIFSDGRKTTVRGTADANKSKKAVWQVMKYLWKNGFDKANLLIPRPVGYIRNINLLLYEEAPGKPLAFLIQKSSQKNIQKFLGETASWLAKLHSLNISGKNIPPAVFLGIGGYAEVMRKIGQYFPELRNKLIPPDRLKFIDKIWQKDQALIHNDFYPGNFIIGKKAFFGIDFDYGGIGPFFMDLATLYLALEFPQKIWQSNISAKNSKEYQKVFLKKYCQIRGLDYPRVSREIKKFLIKILLDQICYTMLMIEGTNCLEAKEKEKLILKIKIFLELTGKILEKL